MDTVSSCIICFIAGYLIGGIIGETYFVKGALDKALDKIVEYLSDRKIHPLEGEE